MVAARVQRAIAAEAVGLDANQDVVESFAPQMPAGTQLLSICLGQVIPFDDGLFDAVCILDVLEHVLDQGALLREIHRVLWPEGKLIITVPKRYMFSFLDSGNWKFALPKLHRLLLIMANGASEYRNRYGDQHIGPLYRGIEIGKNRRQPFAESELRRLLSVGQFTLLETDGSGLFERPLALVAYAVRLLRFGSDFLDRLRTADAGRWSSWNLFSLSTKS